ncbi:PREDICTED: tonsoku-like protein [Priapulus caudatus]|uniref:Tonsoku-like protein n=1 Tax=Priapulus caudatus TaxID=37621 RepID=A0ABM1DW05_PRICU|nr:PREDICTED: tonsoku-like protein [Priapulus caudatus]
MDQELLALRKEKNRMKKKGNDKEVAECCNGIGEILSRCGEHEEALSEHKEELHLCQALSDRMGQAIAHRRIGECFTELGNFKYALQHQMKHLELARLLHSGAEEQRAWATLGRTHFQHSEVMEDQQEAKRQLEEARKAFMNALDTAEKIQEEIKTVEYMQMRARLLLNLGLVSERRGDVQRCEEFMRQAIYIAHKHSIADDLYRCNFNLAGMLKTQGKLSQAQRVIEEALKTANKLKDKISQAEALIAKADILLLLGDYIAAKRTLTQAWKLAPPSELIIQKVERNLKATCVVCQCRDNLNDCNSDDWETQRRLNENIGDTLSSVGLFAEALSFYKEALICARKESTPADVLASLYVSLAITHADLQQFEEAVECSEKELICRRGNVTEECRTWLNIADYKDKGGRPYSEIKAALDKALQHAEMTNNRSLKRLALEHLVTVQTSMGSGIADEKKLVTKQLLEELGEEQEEETEEEESQPLSPLDVNMLSSSDGEDEEPEQVKKKKPAWNRRNEKGETPLHRAAIAGNQVRVKELMSQGHLVNPRDGAGWTPLHEAANHGHAEIVRLLTKHGAWVNDRGGRHCGGLTPLHDAAQNGHLSVMQVLLDHKANILAKDNGGQTALDALRAYGTAHRADMDRQEVAACQAMEQDLVRRMVTTGGNPQTTSASLASTIYSDGCGGSDDDSDDDSPLFSSKTKNRQSPAEQPVKRCTMRSRVRGDSDDSSQDATPAATQQRPPTDVASYLTKVFPPSQDLPDMPPAPKAKSACARFAADRRPGDESSDAGHGGYRGDDNAVDAYMEVMQAVGSATARCIEEPHVLRHHPATPAPALIPEEEYVSEHADWLIIDDAPPQNPEKRQRTGGALSQRRRQVQQRITAFAVERGDVREDVEMMGSGGVLSQSRRQVQPQNTVEREEESEEEDIEMFDSGSDSNGSGAATRRVRRTGKPRRTRQLKISALYGPGTQTAVREVDRRVREDEGAAGNSERVAIGPAMRVRVNIEGKVFLIPLPRHEADERRISWLAGEASQRYYAANGRRPQLTLYTKDGAALGSDDIVTDLVTNNEEIVASVETWEMPPLAERYASACEAARTPRYNNITTASRMADSTHCLRLRDLAMRLHQARPLLRSLPGQYALTILDLSGNRLGDEGCKELGLALPSLDALATLNLLGNEVTQRGLRELVDGGSAGAPRLPALPYEPQAVSGSAIFGLWFKV